jgi:hypothetical protein
VTLNAIVLTFFRLPRLSGSFAVASMRLAADACERFRCLREKSGRAGRARKDFPRDLEAEGRTEHCEEKGAKMSCPEKDTPSSYVRWSNDHLNHVSCFHPRPSNFRIFFGPVTMKLAVFAALLS